MKKRIALLSAITILGTMSLAGCGGGGGHGAGANTHEPRCGGGETVTLLDPMSANFSRR